ncbi:hypothetical protein F7725_027841 [Dissostichus mawsoni]|uniref:Uncharacterized protein n=1 Tax=Dissostichus mawsoni TaxID=36200 RepID=A0A7J5XEJ8_DISMA|nr:hypothetical protein F7725_027841 [Dissostichus mawsoni]
MTAAMHLTVLVSLFAVNFCEGEITASAAHHTSLAAEKNSASVTATTNTELPPSTTLQITTAVTTKTGSTASLQTSSQTPNRTEETHPSVTSPQTTTTNTTSNETVSHEVTLPPASDSTNVTAVLHCLSPEWIKADLERNPGLVAILCIFCIVLILLLVVVTIKCTKSRRSNFERLEDVPMAS